MEGPGSCRVSWSSPDRGPRGPLWLCRLLFLAKVSIRCPLHQGSYWTLCLRGREWRLRCKVIKTKR